MRSFLTLSLCLLACFAKSQSTYTFQPDACSGKDVTIFTKNGIPAAANTNFNQYAELAASGWTYSGQGGSDGYSRFLIDFDGLKNIPQGTVISSATLSLYGKSSSVFISNGNTTPNICWIQRVTSTWEESTVTWNTQPSVTTTNQTALPASTSTWNYNVAVNVTQLVQDIINQAPANRYGFLIRLQTESYYRNLLFASSEDASASLHPKLEVKFNTCITTRVGNTTAATLVNEADPLPATSKAGLKGIDFTVSPNPAGNHTKLSFISQIPTPVMIQLVSQDGKVIREKKLNAQKGTNAVEFDLNNELHGLYYFTLKSQEGTTSKGVVLGQ
jgi:hypothetical protein